MVPAKSPVALRSHPQLPRVTTANGSQATLDRIKVHFPKLVARFQQPLICRSKEIRAGPPSCPEAGQGRVWGGKGPPSVSPALPRTRGLGAALSRHTGRALDTDTAGLLWCGRGVDGTDGCVVGFLQGTCVSFDEGGPGSLLQIPRQLPVPVSAVTSVSGAGAPGECILSAVVTVHRMRVQETMDQPDRCLREHLCRDQLCRARVSCRGGEG